jgi:hypothetical protein
MTGAITNFTFAAFVEVPTMSEKGCILHVGANDGTPLRRWLGTQPAP